MFGLFASAFHAGVDPLALSLVRSQGVGPATEAVSAGYGAFHVFATLNLAILAGWIVLARGAWRTRLLGPPADECQGRRPAPARDLMTRPAHRRTAARGPTAGSPFVVAVLWRAPWCLSAERSTFAGKIVTAVHAVR